MKGDVPAKPNSRLLRWLRWAVLAVVLFYFADHLQDNLGDYGRVAMVLDWRIAPIVALTVVIMMLAAWRFWLGMLLSDPGHSYLHSLRHVTVSRLLNTLIPQSGFAYKIGSLTRESGLSAPQAISQLFIFIWLDVIVSLLIASFLLLFIRSDLSIMELPLGIVFGGAAIVTILLPALAGPLTSLLARIPDFAPTARAISERFAEISQVFNYRRPNKLIWRAFMIIAISVAVSIWRMELCFELFGAQVDWAILGMFVVLNRMSNIVSITPGNIGILELGSGILSGAVGLSEVDGVLVVVLNRIVTFLVLTGMAAASIIHQRIVDHLASR